MPRRARVLTLIAAALLGTMYFLPLWSVRLGAPQYPEGIGMDIRLTTVTGAKEHDLNNINALNHYIGMKEIHPESIPELKYMPWILGVLIAAGLVTAALGRRRLLVGWLALLMVAGIAGLADFWRWNYDYGHNLDYERAIIVIPGESYQPPIIGTKQIANFTATSFPNIGGLLAGVAFALGAGALWLSHRRRTSFGVAGALMATACASGTPALSLAAATCVECRMLITDGRFGAVLITETGKRLEFDAIDCLLNYMHSHPQERSAAVWVADAAQSPRMVPADEAAFIRDATLRPPMGITVTFASAPAGQRTHSWSELRDAVVDPSHAH